MTIVRHALGDVKQRLLTDIELGTQTEFLAFVETQTRADVAERLGHRQCRRCQNAGWHAREQTLTQHSRNVDWTRFKEYAAAAPLDPRDVVFERARLEHFEFIGDLAGAA